MGPLGAARLDLDFKGRSISKKANGDFRASLLAKNVDGFRADPLRGHSAIAVRTREEEHAGKWALWSRR